MTVDRQALLRDLQRQVRSLEGDVRHHLTDDPDVAAVLRAEHAEAVRRQRTATSWAEWSQGQVTQAAVAWVLATVFLRFCEDNGLVDDPWLSGPGERRRVAEERQTAWLLRHTDRNDRDWLLASFAHLAAFPSLASLLDPAHNPLHRLSISADGAAALVAFWRRAGDDGHLVHDLTDDELSTRFLGDLYQDLSEAARKQYALLQTPEFVEELILDLTLTPAVETFGLDGLRLIDPTCGSGHFLLGAFHRLLDLWARDRPGMDQRERVQAALRSVHGVDVNPFATAIARFRLTVAALRASGLRRLAQAPGYELHLATGDSLLYDQGRQGDLLAESLGTHQYAQEDLAEHPGILSPGRYHVVVGNPPYITVKDKALNDAYRKAYKTCSGKYALSVPFVELFFRLAVHDVDRAGFVGQITSNSFMKREFGKKLIEDFLPRHDLTHVIDTSGAYIPGHGTPTVIMVGRRRHPRTALPRVIQGIRGEPSAPINPADGLVWRSIVDHMNQPGFEDEYVSVVDLPRERLASHPWSLSGGGADVLQSALDAAGTRTLGDIALRIGVFGIMGVDDAMMTTREVLARGTLESGAFRELVVGDQVRDWSLSTSPTFFPYSTVHELRPLESWPLTARSLWPLRTEMGNRATFSKRTYFHEDRPWYEWHQLPVDRGASPMTITLAFVATHNHFVLDRGGKVFKQSAPVIKLPEGATEDDHFALLGLLNSSTACFWLKQVSHNKGRPGAEQAGADEAWEHRYEFTGTKLNGFPVVLDVRATDIGRRLDGLAAVHAEAIPGNLFARRVPSRAELDEGRAKWERCRSEMIWWQEELDWTVYAAFGLCQELTASGPPVYISPSDRPFALRLANQVAAGQPTSWFGHHNHGFVAREQVDETWPLAYRELVERRLRETERNSQLALLERPEFKRRWAGPTWRALEEDALSSWLLRRVEDPQLWRDGGGRAAARSIGQIADQLAGDAEFLAVMDLWTGRGGSDVVCELTRLVREEHVPFLASLRYKESGTRVHAVWEETWDLQRREDCGEEVGDIPVPPKYKPVDFQRPSYWRHRGKLDVPKERFISYPGAERGADGTLVLGWAGWDHAEQALALAALALERSRSEGWEADRLIPLWAGVAELEPWVRQWHSEPDPRRGGSPAQAVTATLERELTRLGLTRDDLASWRPAAPTRGRGAAGKARS